MAGSFDRLGDWDKAKLLISSIAKEMEAARAETLAKWGLKAEGEAKSHISNQDLPWVELKPETLAEKLRNGYSENILVRTSDYFQAITSWTTKDTVYVGVKKEAIDSEGNVIADIAATHEFGSKSGKIPARPLWRPSLRDTMKWYEQGNTVLDNFSKRIEKYYK